MTSCLRLSQTLATSATASSRNGSPTTSTLMSLTSIGCPKTSPIWLSNGRAAPLSSAAVPPDPRYSPDAYVEYWGVRASTMAQWLRIDGVEQSAAVIGSSRIDNMKNAAWGCRTPALASGSV